MLVVGCGQSRDASPPTITLAAPSSQTETQPVATTTAAPSSAPATEAKLAARGTATLVLVTQGARVLLVSGADRRELTMFPVKIAIDTAKSWTIEATMAGYRAYHQRIDFSDGVIDKTYTIELKP